MADHIGNGSLVGRTDSTLTFATALGQIEITVCTPAIVRVRLARDDLQRGHSYLTRPAWPATTPMISGEDPITVATGSLELRVGLEPLRVEFADATGQVTLRALVADGVTREDTPAGGDDGQARLRVFASFEPVSEQHFYGLGEGGGQFDRLGTMRQLWNTHIVRGPGSDMGVPLLLSTRGYGLFFDNSSDASLTVGRTDADRHLIYHAEQGPLDWYYLAGADLRAVMHEVAELLGHAPLPPRWSLGYLQSTRHFEDTAELLQLPRLLREKRIPCDGLIFLSTYGDAVSWNRGVGHLEFEPLLWPEPAAMLSDMRGQGFHVITHEYPVLHRESLLYEEAALNGYLLHEGYPEREPESRPSTNFQEGQRYIDFSNPEVRRWWWEQHRTLAEQGVEGWWLDGGEGPSASARLHGGDGLTLHNLYDRLRQQAFAEGEAADHPDRRVFTLCRSGGAGMQRDGATCWSGDINNTFATLEAQLPLGLNTGLSGIPYWGTDIGGFFQPIAESGELYVRWFQFGAFCPGFRAHGYVWREHLPWAHGPQIEAICRRYVELRYRLLPYTYTLAWQAYRDGLPLMRPVVLNYPEDPRVWELGSEYLWGDDLLVAPVTREGATAWPVYLPAGGWYDFWTQQRFDGPCGVTVDAPLNRLPLFVRAGAILPLGPVVQYCDERDADEITFLIYPHGDTAFVLYDDDGRSNAYRQGRYALTRVECSAQPGTTALRVHQPEGDRAALPAGRVTTLQILAGRPRDVVLESAGELPELQSDRQDGAGWWYDGQFVHVRLADAHGTVTLSYAQA